MGTQNLFRTSLTKMIPRDAEILSVWLLTEKFTDLIQFATTINGPVTTAEKTKSISYRKETAMILLITMKELKRNHGHHLMRTLATALSVKDQYCGQPITVNIDLQNLLTGKSSAFGGPTFNEQNSQRGRMVGVPIEFGDVCCLMNFLKSKEKLNIETQVIGIAIDKKTEIFPTDPNSNKCLWTEWFDHDMPCNSDGDREVHSEHQQRLEETYTGPLRICRPEEFGGDKSQQEGGSEITQCPAEDAKEGKCMGFSSDPFVQVLKTLSPLEVQCVDQEQTIPKLPPPFIYGSGQKGKKKGKAACLDYKMRYCCKSTAMYRPTSLEIFNRFIPPKLPIGPARGSITVGDGGVLSLVDIRIFPIQGEPGDTSASIKVRPVEGNYGKGKKEKCKVMIEDGAKSTEVHCEYMTKKTPDGAMEIVVDLKQLKGGMFGRLIITSGSGGVVTGIVIQTNTGIKADSSIVDGEPYKKQEQEPKGKNSYGNDGYGDGGREDTDKDVIKTIITNKKGEKMEIISKLDGEKIT